MSIFQTFIIKYFLPLLSSVMVGIVSYVSIHLKELITNFYYHRVEHEEADMVCQAVFQLYPNLSYDEQIQEMITNLQQVLKEKGIILTDLQLRMLIHSSVYRCKRS